jgi:hypothetical protein
MTKEQTISAMQELPNNFDVDELIEKLIFIDKVEKGIQQAENTTGTNHQDVKKIVASWSK